MKVIYLAWPLRLGSTRAVEVFGTSREIAGAMRVFQSKGYELAAFGRSGSRTKACFFRQNVKPYSS